MNRHQSSKFSQEQKLNSVESTKSALVFSNYPKSVQSVPIEYQAAVYAKNERERNAKREAKEKLRLDTLRHELQALKAKIRSELTEPDRIKLEKEIKNKERSIKKTPKPRRKWSPVFAGSFESGKR